MRREDFFRVFREEHREIRDILFDMITSFGKKDFKKSGALLMRLNVLSGPHFRFEEESMYPALIEVYGEAYINKLYTDHDLAIARAKKLQSKISMGKSDEDNITDCINTVRSILPHVSDCEGLSIMVERLDDDIVNSICDSMERTREENIPLLEWSASSRERKPLQIK